MTFKVSAIDFEKWLENKNLKERTIRDYIYQFNRFYKYGKYNQESVNRFLSEGGKVRTVPRAFLLNFQKFLVLNYKQLGLTNDDRLDISEVELPSQTGRAPIKLIKPLTQEEILRLEKHLKDEKEKIKLLLSYYGGLRVGELLKIQVLSFNWEKWKTDMEDVGECTVHGKGDKEGIAFFPGWLMKRTARYIRSKNFSSLSSYIFLNKVESLKDINLQTRIGTWNRKLKAAGIKADIIKFDSEKKIIPDTNIHSHKLRHSWGYHLKNVMCLDSRDIQEILRHSSISTTQRYMFVEKSRIKSILKNESKSPVQ